MSCITGLEFFSSLPMSYLRGMACNTFLNLAKEPADSPFIPYQKELCAIATRHVNGTFQEFKNAFCQTASATAKVAAQMIDEDLKSRRAQMGGCAVFGTICLVRGAMYANKTGNTTLSKVLAVGSVLIGLYAARTFVYG